MSDHTSHKLWGGRFAVPPAAVLEALNRSIGTDFRLWPFDISLSQAWAVALWGAGVLALLESKHARAPQRDSPGLRQADVEWPEPEIGPNRAIERFQYRGRRDGEAATPQLVRSVIRHGDLLQLKLWRG